MAFPPRLLVAVGTLLLTVSCGGQQAVEPTIEAPAAPPPVEEPVSEDAAEPVEPVAQPAAKPTPEEAPAPKEPLSSLCNKMCDAVAPKCTSLQVKGCRSTCDNYETYPAACDATARAALECASHDKDFLFCSNVVPDSCAKRFKALEKCKETGKPPPEVDVQGMRAGWERYPLTGSASVVVPKGIKKTTANGKAKWSVKAEQALYEVEEHPAPAPGKALSKVYLKVARELFGSCSDKMKLHGLIEKSDRSSMQYNMTCPEDTERVGTLHIVGGKLYLMSVSYPKGTTVVLDDFIYSFESK